MPTIPGQTAPTVTPDGAAGVFQRVSVDPNAFGAGVAQAGAGLGRALDQAGDVANKYALEQLAQKNTAAASDNENSFTKTIDDIQYHPDNGFMAKKGKAAVDALPDSVAAIEDARKAAIAATPNPAVRRMLDPIVSRAARGAVRTMYVHANNEQKAYNLSSATNLAETMIDSASLAYNDDYKWGDTIGGLKAQAATIAKLRGEDETGRQVIEQKLVDKAWKDRLDAWQRNDPVGALAKFRASEEAISPALRVTLGHQLFTAAEPLLAAQLNSNGGPAIPAADNVPLLPKGEGLPRGIRNNNPGNIQRSETPWAGKIADGNDPRYESFDSPEAGIRAIAVNLRTYGEKYKLNTVEGIVGRWAPATENDTSRYIDSVSKDLGVKPGEPLNLADPKMLIGLTKAIIKQENGAQPYTDAQVSAGVAGKALPKGGTTYADITPEQALGLRTGHPVVDALAPDQRFKVIEMARTQARQDQVQARQGIEYRVRDDLAAYERGQTPPNAVSGNDVLRAFGQEHGARILQQLAEAQQFGQDVRQVATLPASQQAALLAKRAPQPGEGYEFGVKRQEQLTHAIEQVNRAREQDPASFVLQNTPAVMDAYRAVGNAKKPEDRAAASQAYAQAALAEQTRLEIPNPQVLPKNYVDEITRRFYQPAGTAKDGTAAPADTASIMRGLVSEWGQFWPLVGKQLAKSIPAGAVVIGLGVKPEAEQLIGEALKLKPEQLNQGVPDPDRKDLSERVRAEFEPLRKTLAYQGGGQATYDNFADTAQSMAMLLLQRGYKPKEAAKMAFDSMAGFKYEFQDTWRVPKEALGGGTSVSTVRAGAQMARYDIGEKGELAIPMAPSAVRPEDAAKQWRQTVQDNGFWVTSPGDGGLTLFVKSGLGAQPVLDAKGQPVRRTWQELHSAGSSVSAAFSGDVPGYAARLRGSAP